MRKFDSFIEDIEPCLKDMVLTRLGARGRRGEKGDEGEIELEGVSTWIIICKV